VGYLQGYEPAPAARGVTTLVKDRVQPGLNLYVSGHGPEAMLIDMEGRPRHRWRRPIRDVWPDVDDKDPSAACWRRAHPYPTGELLAIFDGIGLIKLDRDSRLLWSFRGGCHHDLFVHSSGRIYVLARRSRTIPAVAEARPTLEDTIEVLEPDGRRLRTLSLYEAFAKSPYAPLLDRVSRGGDIFHTNTLVILDGTEAPGSPIFVAGRALVSMRNIDTVAVVDLAEGVVTWALSGLWRRQHEPSLVSGGRLLLFDNAGRGGSSQVLELDPLSHRLAWRYPSDPERHLDIASAVAGTTSRLGNGNTLIVESTAGRALEVTREGELVWEFWSPHRAGEKGELIAMLMDVVRLPAGFAGF
jgi:hypothetical protein